jgi:hypothetical protein
MARQHVGSLVQRSGQESLRRVGDALSWRETAARRDALLRTRRLHNWTPFLDAVKERFGRLSVRNFDRPTITRDIREWRDKWADTPRTAGSRGRSIYDELRALLAEIPRRARTVLTTSRGPAAGSGFHNSGMTLSTVRASLGAACTSTTSGATPRRTSTVRGSQSARSPKSWASVSARLRRGSGPM